MYVNLDIRDIVSHDLNLRDLDLWNLYLQIWTYLRHIGPKIELEKNFVKFDGKMSRFFDQ